MSTSPKAIGGKTIKFPQGKAILWQQYLCSRIIGWIKAMMT